MPGIYQEYLQNVYGTQPGGPLVTEQSASALGTETVQGIQGSEADYPLNVPEQVAQQTDGLKDPVASETNSVLSQGLMVDRSSQDGVSEPGTKQLKNTENLAILKKSTLARSRLGLVFSNNASILKEHRNLSSTSLAKSKKVVPHKAFLC